MSYIIEKKLPTPEEISLELPLPNPLKYKVEKDKKEIIEIIEGKDKRKLLIIGPCSAWPSEAVLEYAKKIKEIEEKVNEKIKIVLRVYTQKPRTTLGWTGPFNQPNPFEPADMEEGIKYCRKMMLRILDIGLPISDEILFTQNEGYLNDLTSYLCIGARSNEDQEHRIFASMIEHPVGIKNPTSGDIDIGINSVIASQNPHTFLLHRKQVKSSGNQHAHLILRGGKGKPNISLPKLQKTHQTILEKELINPSIIIDASHENSIDIETNEKNPLNQPKVILNILKIMKEHPELNETIKGFMVESFIKTGKQDLSKANSILDLEVSGLSITDSCIGIYDTENLIMDMYNQI
jgi:3-deoxy-7-phosphoheptulonate synthase